MRSQRPYDRTRTDEMIAGSIEAEQVADRPSIEEHIAVFADAS
jgi:hypothetical protein